MFAEQLNTEFQVELEGKPVSLELVELSELLESEMQERFAVKFRGPGTTLLPQNTYSVQHNRIGSFLLFLVPVESKDGSYFYEAVFNRLLEYTERSVSES